VFQWAAVELLSTNKITGWGADIILRIYGV